MPGDNLPFKKKMARHRWGAANKQSQPKTQAEQNKQNKGQSKGNKKAAKAKRSTKKHEGAVLKTAKNVYVKPVFNNCTFKM